MLQMVDRKAGILVSINAIIISLIISLKSSGFDYDLLGFKPNITLLFCASSLLLSLAAIRPFALGAKQLIGEDDFLVNIESIKEQQLDVYKNKVNSILQNDNHIYESMIEDIFFIGKNIVKKHELLQWSATVFVLGQIFTVISQIFF